MHGGGVHSAELVFLSLMAFVAIFAAIARKLQRPYPIVLVIAGLLLSFFPRVPKVELNPDIIFLIVLPPLLYGAAWTTSWRDFRYNLVSISMLAIGLVAATVFGVARTARFVLSRLHLAVGICAGRRSLHYRRDRRHFHRATCRPAEARRRHPGGREPGQRCQRPGRPGIRPGNGDEVGDANRVGRAAAAWHLLVVGIVIGLLIARLVEWFEKYGTTADRDRRQQYHSLVPFLVARPYTVPVCRRRCVRTLLSRRSARFFSPQVRLQARAVWDAMTFALTAWCSC